MNTETELRLLEDGWAVCRSLIGEMDIRGLRSELGICALLSRPDAFNRRDLLVRLFGSPVFASIVRRARSTLQALTGEELFLIPRVFIRQLKPCDDNITPPHQDFLYIQGSDTTITIWFPLHDLGALDGSLEFLSGSHLLGLLATHAKQGGLLPQAVNAADLKSRKWETADLKVGDAFVFTAMTLHRAVLNHFSQARYSIDFRLHPHQKALASSALISPFTVSDEEGNMLFHDFVSAHCANTPPLVDPISITPLTSNLLKIRRSIAFES